MSISLYRLTVPAMIPMLNNLAAILEKAQKFCESRNIDSTVLTGARLFPDMFPLSRQVQIVSDTAKGCAARLTGQEPPRFEDTEKTLEELIARLRKTVDYLSEFREAQFEGADEREVVLKFPSTTLNFHGQSYVQQFVLPNFYFHVTTAYNILRHNGVELGKRDYLG